LFFLAMARRSYTGSTPVQKVKPGAPCSTQ
jgi:hypothetical protein